VRVLSAAQIERGLSDRWRLLGGGPRHAMARQQTLLASVAWSHDLLLPVERVLLRRLSVFAGGFSLEAAEGVCADADLDRYEVFDVLVRLVDRSLVIAADEGPTTRYRMLDTIRQYAADRLVEAAEAPQVRTRHLEYFATLTTAWREPARRRELFNTLTYEYENVRAALDWGLREGQAEIGLRMASALPWYWLARGLVAEGKRWVEELLARAPDLAGVEQSLSWWALGMLAANLGDLGAGAAAMEKSLEYARDADDPGAQTAALTHLAMLRAGCAARIDAAEEAIDLARRGAEDGRLIDALFAGAMAHRAAGDSRHALALFEEAREAARRRPPAEAPWSHLTRLGEHLLDLGQFDRAEALLDDVVADGEARGIEIQVLQAHFYQARLAYARGHLDQARAIALDGIGGWEKLGDQRAVAVIRTFLAEIDLDEGLTAKAAADARVELRDASIAFADAPLILSVLGALAAAAGDLAQAAADLDEAMTTARASEATPVLGRALLERARVSRMKGEREEAETRLHEALRIWSEVEYPAPLADTLEELGGLAIEAASTVEGTRLLAAAAAIREQVGCVRPRRRDAHRRAAIDGAESDLGAQAFASAYAEGAALSLAEAVAYARRGRGMRKRPPHGWPSLTPTEIDVVRLAPQGLTNPQIAARLFVGRETVKTHLTNVYMKLGLASRAELAAEATRQGV
jgi:DNA-binding CsgD family transcriptional regulator